MASFAAKESVRKSIKASDKSKLGSEKGSKLSQSKKANPFTRNKGTLKGGQIGSVQSSSQ